MENAGGWDEGDHRERRQQAGELRAPARVRDRGGARRAGVDREGADQAGQDVADADRQQVAAGVDFAAWPGGRRGR